MNTPSITEFSDNLTTADRCDSCGAQAYVQVLLEQGDLLFCGHHYKENEERLTKNALVINDETHKLLPSKYEPEDVE